MSEATQFPATGTEIQFTENGQTLRGWIVCQDPKEVGVYPPEGEESESRLWPLEGVQVLKEQQPLEGWEGLCLENSKGDTIEVRLPTRFVNSLREDAKNAGLSLEELILDYLRAGLEGMLTE